MTLLSARADMMIPLSIEELSARAQLVLQGKVLSTTVQRDTNGGIYTKVELQVEEVWKGSLATNQFNIVLGGGILGDRGLSISGQVEYEVGEEVVAFLVLDAEGQGITVGLSQGKFQISQDSATGEKLVHNRFHGRHPSAPNHQITPQIHDPNIQIHLPRPIINRLTLPDLKQRCLAAGGGK